MAKKKGDYLIPFRYDHVKGHWHMVSYTSAREGQIRPPGTPPNYYSTLPDEWRPNKPFYAAIRLTGHYRGRSSARFGCVSVNPLSEGYSMGMEGFYEAVTRYGVLGGEGTITGWWAFRKQGTNYGLFPSEKPND